MRTRNGRRKVPFGTNYPMIFHDPALADLDALAFADEARELYLSANAQRLFEEGPRRLLCLGERERAGRRVWCPQRTRRSDLVGSPRLLHAPEIAQVRRRGAEACALERQRERRAGAVRLVLDRVEAGVRASACSDPS